MAAMRNAPGKLAQIFLGPDAAGQITCPPALIPAPGQYLLATCDSDLAAPLPVPIFLAAPAAGGFIIAPPLPDSWVPGASLNLRGPLGKGFSLPRTARSVTLVALGRSAARLLPLVALALAQDASVLILCEYIPGSLPHEVEILPLSGLPDAAAWADFMALDLPRQSLEDIGGLPGLRGLHAQALVETPLPCGGMADCGACAVHLRHGFLLACKDGPVVDLRKLI